MMNDELVFESLTESRYAPSLQEFDNSLYDADLEKQMRNIPDKLAFKIGEVADIVGVKTYVLRYWETEFDVLHPDKSKNGQRIYLKKDVELILMIKKLLYRDRFSIEGARVSLRRLRKDSRQARAVGGPLDAIQEIKVNIEDLSLHIASLRRLFQI
jgi:DNA-binding transcriptional MerR regulator